MKFSYNWLKEYIGEKMPQPKKLAELLTMHSLEVEEAKKTGKDWFLDIDVLPNRIADCASHIGIAREISALLKARLKVPVLKLSESKKLKAKGFLSLEIKDKNFCPRYTARVIVRAKVGSSPKWIKERLKICGLRPINNIVDIANYVMLETGQPLHAFDFEKIKSSNKTKKLIVRFAKKGEKIVTLDNENYNLNENILVIADEENPIAFAGIKGGKKTEIDSKTKAIVLESANFKRENIYQVCRETGLRTDASIRFSADLDPNLTSLAIDRAAALIQKIAGGEIAQGLLDFYPKKVLPKKIKFELDYFERLLGLRVPKKEAIIILRSLGFKVKELKNNVLQVLSPTIRSDISTEEDLIEEVGRIWGYQKIPVFFPAVSLMPAKRNDSIFWQNACKNTLKELGFSEVYNYSFISQKDAADFNYFKGDLAEVKNPLSLEQKYLCSSLIPNLLKTAQKNKKYFDKIKIFELGKVFEKKEKSRNILEKNMLAGLITGNLFYEVKGLINFLLNSFCRSDICYSEPKKEAGCSPKRSSAFFNFWHSKKYALIKVGGQEIGVLGEISPLIANNLKIEDKAILFNLDFERLVQLASEKHEYEPISKYPTAIRDIALLVPEKVKVGQVLNKIHQLNQKLIKKIELFDVYQGKEIAFDKKNLAFRITYQSEDRTLSSKEIDQIQNKIIQALEEEKGWEVRK